jgi:hypothetical protein
MGLGRKMPIAIAKTETCFIILSPQGCSTMIAFAGKAILLQNLSLGNLGLIGIDPVCAARNPDCKKNQHPWD